MKGFYNYNNFNNRKNLEVVNKKAKSSNRVQKDKMQLPSLKVAINMDNKYIRNGYLEIMNQNIGKKKNHSQLHYQIQKSHKPYSGNPLKFHNKKELKNINGIKYYPEREIFTANPYLIGYNGKKKNYVKKKSIFHSFFRGIFLFTAARRRRDPFEVFLYLVPPWRETKIL